MSCVGIGVVKGMAMNATRTFEVPFMTNTIELHRGDEFILELVDKVKPPQKPQKKSWKEQIVLDGKAVDNTKKTKGNATVPSA